jgi:hypothetical protein
MMLGVITGSSPTAGDQASSERPASIYGHTPQRWPASESGRRRCEVTQVEALMMRSADRGAAGGLKAPPSLPAPTCWGRSSSLDQFKTGAAGWNGSWPWTS